jgi:hypothetical protein
MTTLFFFVLRALTKMSILPAGKEGITASLNTGCRYTFAIG